MKGVRPVSIAEIYIFRRDSSYRPMQSYSKIIGLPCIDLYHREGVFIALFARIPSPYGSSLHSYIALSAWN